jgi:hypothetical protein
MIEDYFYPSGLLPAAPVSHGYKNVWIRDMYYIGICSSETVRLKIWQSVVAILDRYKWKLEIHSKKPPIHWYEFIHVRYNPEGFEIENEHWLHNQFDAYANFGEICLDLNRIDLVALFVDYLYMLQFHKKPSAGAWEDRNTCDAYSLAACLHFLQRSKSVIPNKVEQIDHMIKLASKRLYSTLLPYATFDKKICLSLLGVIWPYNMAGPYKNEILELVMKYLYKEPFGFIRYVGDSYSGEHFDRIAGTETPWLLGDCFLHKIEPDNDKWIKRLDEAIKIFKCLPEAYDIQTMTANRNTPLLWAEAMYQNGIKKTKDETLAISF